MDGWQLMYRVEHMEIEEVIGGYAKVGNSSYDDS